jgi:hypothetical protein
LGTAGSAARDVAAHPPPVRTYGPWALDQLRPAPELPITWSLQWARESRRWIGAHTIASHRDHQRGWGLSIERPDEAPAIWAEARDALDRRETELDAAQTALDECRRVLGRAGRPLHHGPA